MWYLKYEGLWCLSCLSCVRHLVADSSQSSPIRISENYNTTTLGNGGIYNFRANFLTFAWLQAHVIRTVWFNEILRLAAHSCTSWPLWRMQTKAEIVGGNGVQQCCSWLAPLGFNSFSSLQEGGLMQQSIVTPTPPPQPRGIVGESGALSYFWHGIFLHLVGFSLLFSWSPTPVCMWGIRWGK